MASPPTAPSVEGSSGSEENVSPSTPSTPRLSASSALPATENLSLPSLTSQEPQSLRPSLVLTPSTPRPRKQVSFSPLPPPSQSKMARIPVRSTSTSDLSQFATPTRQNRSESPATEPSAHPDRPLTPLPQADVSPPTTPTQSSRLGGVEQLRSMLGQSPPKQPPKFRPLPGNPFLPLDIVADGFLKTKKFEVICNIAMAMCLTVPFDPPPQSFESIETTPMHPWFENLITVFTERFAKRLRDQGVYPHHPAQYAADGRIIDREDHAAFATDVCAHVNAMFASFRLGWNLRTFSSYDNIFCDFNSPFAAQAFQALGETAATPTQPPKKNWKTGEALAPFYELQIRRFRGEVCRVLEDRPEDHWMLTCPQQLERGMAGYEQYHIDNVRQKILKHNGEKTDYE